MIACGAGPGRCEMRPARRRHSRLCGIIHKYREEDMIMTAFTLLLTVILLILFFGYKRIPVIAKIGRAHV